MSITLSLSTTPEASAGVSSAVPRRFTAGDGLRAIATTSVLVFHAGIATLLWKLGHGSVNGEGTAGQFVGVTAATLLGAELLWRFVEHPALQRRLPWRPAEFKGAVPVTSAES